MIENALHELGRWLLVLCVFGAVAYSYALHIRRKWAQAAQRLGLTYTTHDPERRLKTWNAQLAYFSSVRGDFSHILEGTFQGRPVLVAQYGWRQGKHSVSQTVACFNLTREAPPFILTSESLGDKLAAAFGAQDIDFDDDPAFSSAFVLKGEDQRVRAYFGPMLRRRLADAAGWVIVGHGTELAVFKRARTVPPDDIETFIRDTRRVAELFA